MFTKLDNFWQGGQDDEIRQSALIFYVPNFCQCTTVWNIDVSNCCITLSYFPSKHCNDLIKHKINLNVNYLAKLKVSITTRLQIIRIYVQSEPCIQKQWLRCNAIGW